MKNLFQIIPAEYALQHHLVPLFIDEQGIHVAMDDPQNYDVIREIEFFTEQTIIPVKWEWSQIFNEINTHYNIAQEVEDKRSYNLFQYREIQGLNEKKDHDEHTIIKWVDELVSEAIARRASDIHIESEENSLRVRFRIDGVLWDWDKKVNYKKEFVISRLKIMAHLDIAEKRRPQDGRFSMQSDTDRIDVRVSTLPTTFGEKIVLRLLDKSSLILSLDGLGFDLELTDNLKRILRSSYGMILVTGPTGSGKTTTLYSALQFVNKPEVNIITVEDPIEYHIPGINQTNVKPAIGLNFAAILRTILRQDPDIIMVGEIRDRETAEIAVRAALTGHLVLSTLHTNDAPTTIIRLIDMGIEPFLLAGALKMVIAQRLLRKICPSCKAVDGQANDLLPEYFQHSDNQFIFYEGRGCPHCHFTGYYGRCAVAEYILIDEEMAGAVQRFNGLNELISLARMKGFKTLKEASLQKCLDGITSLSELFSEVDHL